MNTQHSAAVSFGKALLASGDLDPIYLMLRRASLHRDQLRRWCLAYWMFYHAGVASRITEAGSRQFWPMVQKAQDEKWPRGTERRYYRGVQAQRSIDRLREAGSAEQLVEHTLESPSYRPHPVPHREMIRRAKSWLGFGDWISFKIADMMDAVLDVPVNFDTAIPDFFNDPLLGGALVAHELAGTPNPLDIALDEQRQRQIELTEVAVRYLSAHLGHVKAPHADRAIRMQELETILCKYKSHRRGRYPVGKDTREIRHGLSGWGDLAEAMANHLPEVPDGED